jgi:hypothetical protein
MPSYRVKPGRRHGSHKQYGPGDIVELTEFEAATLLDKLQLIEDDGPPKQPETVDLSRIKVDDILAQIDAGTLDVAVALKAEEASSRPRVTLIDALKERLEGGE